MRCSCCGLEQPIPATSDLDAPRCLRCAEHRGTGTADVAARDADHAQLYRRALSDAQDDVLLARSESAHYRDKMQAAYATREMLVRALSAVEDAHHYRGSRCSCGKRACRVVDVVGDPRVLRLIRSYDEERRTLRELRSANPDLWVDSWDYIDVTLVYPKRQRRHGGRHRASG